MSHLFPTVPNFLGFESLFDSLERFASTMPKIPNWPPYNVKKEGENQYLLEFALAGFDKSNIQITLEGDQLVVKGNTVKEGNKDTATYLHRGIGLRSFEQRFPLADGMIVKDASFTNGVLKIALDQLAKISNTVKQIEVK